MALGKESNHGEETDDKHDPREPVGCKEPDLGF